MLFRHFTGNAFPFLLCGSHRVLQGISIIFQCVSMADPEGQLTEISFSL